MRSLSPPQHHDCTQPLTFHNFCQAPSSARSEFLKRLVAEGDDEEEEEAKKAEAEAAAAAAAAAAQAKAAPAAAAAGGDVPDLDVEEDVAKIPEVWRPPVWPEQGTHSEKYSLPCPCIANALGR